MRVEGEGEGLRVRVRVRVANPEPKPSQVSTSTPVSLISSVCSNCAEGWPSFVTAVQPSGLARGRGRVGAG